MRIILKVICLIILLTNNLYALDIDEESFLSDTIKEEGIDKVEDWQIKYAQNIAKKVTVITESIRDYATRSYTAISKGYSSTHTTIVSIFLVLFLIMSIMGKYAVFDFIPLIISLVISSYFVFDHNFFITSIYNPILDGYLELSGFFLFLGQVDTSGIQGNNSIEVFMTKLGVSSLQIVDKAYQLSKEAGGFFTSVSAFILATILMLISIAVFIYIILVFVVNFALSHIILSLMPITLSLLPFTLTRGLGKNSINMFFTYMTTSLFVAIALGLSFNHIDAIMKDAIVENQIGFINIIGFFMSTTFVLILTYMIAGMSKELAYGLFSGYSPSGNFSAASRGVLNPVGRGARQLRRGGRSLRRSVSQVFRGGRGVALN